MKLRIFSASILIVSLMLLSDQICLGALSDSKEGILMDGVAAYVNDHVVTVSEVLAIVAPEHRRLSQQHSGKELKRHLDASYRETLNIVVERYLVLDAYKKQGVTLPDWVVDRRIDDIINNNFGKNRSKLLETLAADGVTYEEWRKDMLDRIIVSTMNSAHVTDKIMVSPGQVRAEFKRNASKYASPEQVKLRLIVKERDDEGVALKAMKDLVKRLAAGEDFGELAKKSSSGNKAADGGLWDWVEPKMLRDELVKAISALKNGEISEVIETEGELYIVKLEERRNTGVDSFDQVQAKIERSLREKAAEKLYVSWMERLREGAYVKLVDVELF